MATGCSTVTSAITMTAPTNDPPSSTSDSTSVSDIVHSLISGTVCTTNTTSTMQVTPLYSPFSVLNITSSTLPPPSPSFSPTSVSLPLLLPLPLSQLSVTRYPNVDEIQEKVLCAVESLIDYWDATESYEINNNNNSYNDNNINNNNNSDSNNDNRNSSNDNNNGSKYDKCNKSASKSASKLKIHDLTEDAAERSQVMFLHPSLRQKTIII